MFYSVCLWVLGSSWGRDPDHRTGDDGRHGHFHGEVASYWPDDQNRVTYHSIQPVRIHKPFITAVRWREYNRVGDYDVDHLPSEDLLHFRAKQKKLLSNNNIKCGKLFIGSSTINYITNYTTTGKYCKLIKGSVCWGWIRALHGTVFLNAHPPAPAEFLSRTARSRNLRVPLPPAILRLNIHSS